ncbi:MAG: anti-sigma factor family protein, partial [Armatimonadota bacterium]
MKCGKVRDLFSRYLENATDGRITARVEEHLSACESCRRAYQRFRATVAMLDSIPEVEPPADFHATVMAQVERAKRAAPAPVRWWTVDWQHVFTIRVPVRAAAVGIAAILLFVLAFQLFPPLRTGIASLLLPQKPAPAPISSIDDNAVRTPLPWSPKTSGPGLQISVEPEKPGTYSVRLGTTSKKQVAFEVEVDGTKYSGSLAAGAGSQIKVPAPSAGSVAVVHIAWSIG